MQDILNAMGDAEDAASAEDLGRQLKHAITDIGDATDPAQMDRRQVKAYTQIRYAMEVMRSRGYDEAKVMESAVRAAAARFSDPADAETMLRRFIKPRQDEQPKPIADGILPAGGAKDLFGNPAFETKPGGQEKFGFGVIEDAAKREHQRTYSPEIERKKFEGVARTGDDAKIAGKFDETATPEMFNRGESPPPPTATAETSEPTPPEPKTPAAPAAAAAAPAPAAPSRSNPRVSAFRALADKMQGQVDARLNPAIANQNPTARRARIAEGMYAEGQRLQRVQTAMRKLADAHEAGAVPDSLKSLGSRAQVEDLIGGRAYPAPYANPAVLRQLIDKLKGKPGIPDVRDRIGYVGDGGKLRPDQAAAVRDLLSLARRHGVDYGGYNIDVSRGERLAKAGITDEESFSRAKADLEQLAGERQADPKAELRRMEHALLGRDIPGFFPTPRPVVDRLLQAADIQPGMSVLEPSAGKGDILDVIRERHPDAKAKGIEQYDTLAAIAREKGHDVTTGDTLAEKGEQYDRIVMNPPFEKGQDIEHVRAAFDRLKPGGKLVAVMSEGPFFRNDAKATEFRDWLEANGGTSEQLPAGSFTGKDAFRQTGTATRMVVIDKPAEQPTGEGPTRNPMRPRGAVNIGILKTPVHAAGEGAAALRNIFVDDLVDRAGRSGGKVGEEVVQRARAAIDTAKEAMGEVSVHLNKALRLAGGGKSPSLHKAVGWLQEVDRVPGKNYGVSRLLDAVEGRTPPGAPPATTAIVGAVQDLTAKLGRMYAANGHMQQDARTGKWRPFKTTRGDIFVRVPTFEMQRILRDGPGGKLWNQAIDAFADINGIPRPDIERVFQQQHDDLAVNAPDAMFRRLQAEFTRQLPRVPTVLYAGGDVVPLFETNPFSYAKRLAENGAARIGFIKHFGQQTGAGVVTPASIFERYIKAGGRGEHVIDLMRSLNNTSVEPPLLDSGSAGAKVMRGVNDVVSLIKSGLLTASAVQNILEPLGNTQGFSTGGDLLRAIRDLTTDPRGTIVALETLGAITKDVGNYTLDPNRPVSSVIRTLRNLSTKAFLHGYVNEFQEKLAATVGMEKAERLRAGKGTSRDVYDLRSIGYSMDDAKRLVAGRGTPEEYDAIPRRAGAALVGNPMNPAEKSRASHNRWYRAAVAFETYAQVKIRSFFRQAAAYLETTQEAVRTRDANLLAAAHYKFARHILGTTASGAAAYMLMALATGGTSGLKIAWNEAKDEPLKFVGQSWAYSTLIGPFGALIRLAGGSNDSTADKLVRLTLPGFLLKEAADAATSQGTYRNMDGLERSTKLLGRIFPVNRIFATAAAAFGLGTESHELDTALRGYWRWRMDNKPPDRLTPGEQPDADKGKFRVLMKSALQQMQRGDDPLDTIRKALDLKEGKDLAAAIRAKRLLPALEPAEREALKRHIGPDAYKRVEAWDDLLSRWEQSVQFESKHNVNVQGRFGGRLAALDADRDDVERGYKPVKKLMTGDGMHDMDVENQHAGLVDRRRDLGSSVRELANIRREIKRIEADPDMSEAEKRRAIEDLNEQLDGALQAAGY
jgi:hypothetical protein